MAVASFDYGYVMFETLKECERRFPNRLNIVGLVTDDPANPEVKISMKRRIWRMIERKAESSKLTIHQITEEVDAGHIVGQSPPIIQDSECPHIGFTCHGANSTFYSNFYFE